MSRNILFQPIVILLSLILGFICSFNSFFEQFFIFEEPLLFVLLFFIFLEIKPKQLKNAFKNKRFLFTELILNFIFIPILAYFLGHLFFAGKRLEQIALVLIMVMPCTDMYLVFTDFSGGNIALSSSVLPYNLILQLLLLPLYLIIFFHLETNFIDFELLFSTFLEILIPIIAAIIVRNFLFKRNKKIKKLFKKYHERVELILLSLIAFVIFAANGQEIFTFPDVIGLFFLCLVCFYLIMFLISLIFSKFLKLNKKDSISLSFVVTSRNTPLSLSLAAVLFASYPLIGLLLLCGPLSEIPISIIESYSLRLIYHV